MKSGYITITAIARTEFICQKTPNSKDYYHVLYLKVKLGLTLSLYADSNSIIKGKGSIN